jgi:membrane protein YdbS with pleckstrin-like domain
MESAHVSGSGIPDQRPFDVLHPSAKKLWFVEMLIATAILTVFSGLFELFRWISGRPGVMFFGGLITGIVLLVGIVGASTLPRLRYRYWRYRLDEEELALTRGILTRVHTVVPLIRVQHMDVSQNIIEREMELAKLVVHTAGTRNNVVVVPGLDLATAEVIRDRLRGFVRDDAV